MVPRLAWPSWRWMMFSGTPSRASSSSSAWRSWCGANLRLTPAPGREAPELAADGGARPRPPARRAVDDAEQRPNRQLGACAQPRPQLFPAPVVHPDLASASALAVADEQRPAPRVEVVLIERECLLGAQPGAPEHDDHRAPPAPVAVRAGVAHDRDDLVDGGRVSGAAHPLVARRAAGVIAGTGRRRATPACRIEHGQRGHRTSLDRTAGTALPYRTHAGRAAARRRKPSVCPSAGRSVETSGARPRRAWRHRSARSPLNEAVAQITLGSGVSICDGTTHVQSRYTSQPNGTRPSPAWRKATRLPPLRFLSFSEPFTRQPCVTNAEEEAM